MSRSVGDTELASELADLALVVAREAAALVRERASRSVEVAATKTSATDPVTEADRACEALVRARLLAARPDDAVLGEEGDDVDGTSGVRWVVDPIDGTVNFLYGLPVYAVSIAAEVTVPGRDPEIVAGVVLNVASGVAYVARPGPDGATVALRDDVPLRVRPRVPLGERLIGTGFSYDPALRARQGEAVARLLPRVRDVRRIGSCSMDLCFVAEGGFDGYVEEGTHLWDYAAGALIAQAAGARVRQGTGISGRMVLVCGPEDGFEDLWEAVHDVGLAVAAGGAPVGE